MKGIRGATLVALLTLPLLAAGCTPMDVGKLALFLPTDGSAPSVVVVTCRPEVEASVNLHDDQTLLGQMVGDPVGHQTTVNPTDPPAGWTVDSRWLELPTDVELRISAWQQGTWREGDMNTGRLTLTLDDTPPRPDLPNSHDLVLTATGAWDDPPMWVRLEEFVADTLATCAD